MKLIVGVMFVVLAFSGGCDVGGSEDDIANGCYEGDFRIEEEADVDDILPYTCINGSLSINGPLIDSVVLPNLERVEGDLSIGPSFLVDFDFPALTTIGSWLSIHDNYLLEHLTGFEQLQSVGSPLSIVSNDSLQEINGFESLTQIGGLTVALNDILHEVVGFQALVTIEGELEVSANEALVELKGFDSLAEIGGNIWIWVNSQLTLIDGFRSLTNLGGRMYLDVMGAEKTLDVKGFDSFSTVGEDLYVEGPLSDVAWLSALLHVGEDFSLFQTNVTSLAPINSQIEIEGDLSVSLNEFLPYCEICDLLDELVNEPTVSSVWGNQLDDCFVDEQLFCE